MRTYFTAILLFLLPLSFGGQVIAEETLPMSGSTRFPNITASLEDGFFSLAERQIRNVLKSPLSSVDSTEVSLLLAHALWGQKRYIELLDLLEPLADSPGVLYWRVRANFELRRYSFALKILDSVEQQRGNPYVPSLLRLKGRVEQQMGRFDAAETTFRMFAKTFPEDFDQIENQFDLANVLIEQKRIPEAISIYETLGQSKELRVAHRAQLKLAQVLYVQGAKENFDRSRGILVGLSTNKVARLADRISALVELSALEEKAENRPEAMAALQKAAALSPDARQRVPLKLTIVHMLRRDGDTSAALKLLEQCRAEAPNEIVATELQLEKADTLLQAEQYAEADAAYQVYLDVATNPDGLAHAYFGKGLALWSIKRYAESAAALDKAVKGLVLPSEKADALFKAGDAYYRSGKFEEAGKRYRLFVTDFPKHKNVPMALYQLGLSLTKAGHQADAQVLFRTLEKDYAVTPFAEKAALRSADILRENQQWDAALKKFTQISQTYTNSPSTQAISEHQRGLVLYQLGRYAEAQKAFDGVIKKYPKSTNAPQATYMRGFCLYFLGQIDEAVKTCRDYIHDYPDSEWTPEVIFWLAEQYYNRGDYKAAEPLFLRIVKDFKTHKLAPRALYWAGRAAAAQANYVGAIERYGEVAKTYPDSEIIPHARFAQGDALSELGEFARAILAFDEIIKNYPESYLVNSAWGRKGDCQFSLAVDNPSRYAEAINSFQAILDRPSAPVTLKLQAEYKIGRCLEKTNDLEKAFSHYMNVVYTFINENVEHSPYSVMWFTRSAFGSAALKEREKAWLEAVKVYERVIEANVPSKDEAIKRIEKIKKDNWLLFEQAEEKKHVGIDG